MAIDFAKLSFYNRFKSEPIERSAFGEMSMRKISVALSVLGLVLGALLLTPLPGTGIGFQDHNPEPCLGSNDPFCDGGDGEDGGGGGSTACYSCSFDFDTSKLECIEGTHGSTCTIVHKDNKETCEPTGSC